MNNLKSKPFFFSFVIISLIIILHKIPIDNLLINLGLNKYNSETLDKIIINSISIIGIYFLLMKSNIPFNLFSINLENFKYYIPLLFYVFIFSGGFRDFRDFDFNSISINTFSLYTLKYFSSSFLEEFLFRGFILGLFLVKYLKSKRGILKSVVFSGLIFGFMHIVNFWTIEGETFKGVLNQAYATSCFGIMYGATYLKTRSIATLGLLHFISNFFSSIKELEITSGINNLNTITSDKTLIFVIISEVFRLFIFGIPLIIGLFLIYNTNREDLKTFISGKHNVA